MNHLRATNDVVIDSHAVTREDYGFRAVPYSASQLQSLKLDAVVVLRCDPEMLIARVALDPGGRRGLSPELAREIQILQESLSLQYAVVCGCPIFIIDTTRTAAYDVVDIVIRILEHVGVGTQ